MVISFYTTLQHSTTNNKDVNKENVKSAANVDVAVKKIITCRI